jgi:hypothetical protein
MNYKMLTVGVSIIKNLWLLCCWIFSDFYISLTFRNIRILEIPAALGLPHFQKFWFSGIRHHFTDECVRTLDTCRHSTQAVPICIIKLTLRDKHEHRSVQIIGMETTRSKQQTVFTLVFS